MTDDRTDELPAGLPRPPRATRREPSAVSIQDRAISARRRLRNFLQNATPPLDLIEASLVVASQEYPDLDFAAERRKIEALGAEAARRVLPLANPFAKIEALREYLFEEQMFRGNVLHYDDPRNSMLNEVLERRLGIPLTLSIVYMEVAARAGLRTVGVALPGHFIARVDDAGRSLLVDPFHGGHVISEEDCRDLVVRTTGRASLFRRDVLDGTAPRAMLARLLLNLKRIYLARGDYDRALSAVERLLLVTPDDGREIRDRGLLLAHLGRNGAAVADLESYLASNPEAADADSVRGRVQWLLKRISESN